MMENLEFLEGQVSQEIEEFTDDERTVGKHENGRSRNIAL